MFILLICSSLTSKFIVEIDDNATAVIYVDLISCLLKVECYFFKTLLGNAKSIVCTVINTQRVRQIFIAQLFTQVLECEISIIKITPKYWRAG